MELPRYKSHKEVQALKIADVDGVYLTPEDPRFKPFEVSQAYIERHKPQVGGYYVVYADGYESFSPAPAFEEGYTLVE